MSERISFSRALVRGTGLVTISSDVFAVSFGQQEVGGRVDPSAVNSTLYAAATANQAVSFEAEVFTVSLAPAIADFNPATNITLGVTPKATAGAAPPAIGLTTNGAGSRTFATGCPGLQVRVSDVSGGTARGQAEFQISTDDGTTWSADILTAATHDITTGPAAGLSLTFPVGTYATDQRWAGTVETWRDTTNTHIMTNTTVGQQPIYLAHAFGVSKPGLQYDGTDDRLVGTITAITDEFKDTLSFTLVYKAAFAVVDGAASQAVVSIGNTAGTTGKRYFGQSTTGSGRYNTSYRNDANAAVNTDRSVNDVDTSAHVFVWYTSADGTQISLSLDDGTANPAAAAANPGALTPNRVCFGAEFDNAPGLFFNGKQGRTRFISSVLDASQRTAEHLALAA